MLGIINIPRLNLFLSNFPGIEPVVRGKSVCRKESPFTRRPQGIRDNGFGYWRNHVNKQVFFVI